jgi:hypothetical protein
VKHKERRHKEKDERKMSAKLARCACCGGLSSDKQWKQTKGTGSNLVALGDSCLDCGDIYDHGSALCRGRNSVFGTAITQGSERSSKVQLP